MIGRWMEVEVGWRCCLWMDEKSEVKWRGRGGGSVNVIEREVG